MIAPTNPPITKTDIIKMKLFDKISIDKKVTVIATTIPKIPNKLPCLEVSGDDNPLRANINNTPEIKYNDAAKFGVINLLFSFLFFIHLQHSLCYQKSTKYVYRGKHYRCKSKYVR